MTPQTTHRSEITASSRDISGFAIFDSGEMGAAHVMAHRLFDGSRIEEGHARLGDWLATHSGSGSGWTHLQFHMALFELTLGQRDAAHVRFTNEILPVAATTDDALTDAPALAWRLALAAPGSSAIVWDALRNTALRGIGRPTTPFVMLHHLLALAGADDVESIESWLSQNRCRGVGSLAGAVLTSMAIALGAWCRREYRAAASALQKTVPKIHLIGGSHAQQQLFIELELTARQRATATTPTRLYKDAA